MNDDKKETPIYKNWRFLIFVIALAISVIAIGPWYSAEEGFTTNLNYGLDIEGGSWIQLELNGVMASLDADPKMIVQTLSEKEIGTSVNMISSNFNQNGEGIVSFSTAGAVNSTRLEFLFGPGISTEKSGDETIVKVESTKTSLITSYLTSEFNTEVITFWDKDSVWHEIRTKVPKEQLDASMKKVGGSVKEYKNGVTKDTMRITIDVLNNKLGNGLGVKDLPIRSVGDEYILIDFAGISLDEAEKYVSNPGKFEIRMQATENETIHVLYGESIVGVNAVVQDPRTKMWYVPFSLNDEGAVALKEAAVKTGATRNPISHNLIMILDDEEIYSAPLSFDAADQLERGIIYSWQATTSGQEEAKELQIHLRAGALPVNVEIIGSGEAPAALGEGFKRGSIITAIFAMIVVGGAIYAKYKRVEIALPMILTSVSEVIMLLGLSVLIKQQLDLASIAGIIAVIGTGVDHLIIITEETVREGKIPSSKLYASRLGKAFSVIFGAAATTIIAMTPLLFLGFGSLKGFAVTTIAGVLIGILIARPVYGVVLHEILMKRGFVDEKQN
ncbi:MAG: preprotein translocase subunit SecD [Methanosarcinaceae archaeon]|nr:preprotein translocase subunit SecD [Methanosarcinaceae archaeon]